MMPTVDRAMPMLKELNARYGGGKGEALDPASMSPEDARALQSLKVEIQPALQEQALALDLQHIRAWWATAEVVYSARKEDIATYADIEHIDDTLKAKLKDMTNEQQALVGLWHKIDERVLSREQAQMDQIAKAPQAP